MAGHMHSWGHRFPQSVRALFGARKRALNRERALSSAGAGFAACSTRGEALEITLGAALDLAPEASSTLIMTVAGPSLRVIAAAGSVGSETAGCVAEVTALPAEAQALLKTGDSALVRGQHAKAVTTVLRLPQHPELHLAPLAARGHIFGMFVLALERPTADDLSPAVRTLAGEAALTLDRLLIQSRLSICVEHSPDALLLAGEAGRIRVVNPAAAVLLKTTVDDLLGRDIRSLMHPDDLTAMLDRHTEVAAVAQTCRVRGDDAGEWTETEALIEYVTEHDGSRSMVFSARDVSERRRLELELRHAQKLDSVGRLAAGIAHEINTPIQFVSDNIRFLDTSFADLGRLCDAYGDLINTAKDGHALAETVSKAAAIADDIDIGFVQQEVPLAITQSLDGLDQVAGIVRAMKAFGHPGLDTKSRADLNEAIGHTLVVAANEIDWVADVEIDLGDLPLVCCHIGDINQVLLNLIVNAAHAIASADRGRGTIKISTRLDGTHAVIEITDTGTGVPPEIADKLFDPFFTTKDVGTGTGQGLALVRSLVTDRHGGTVNFTTQVGVGTTFTIWLPVDGNEPLPDADPASRNSRPRDTP
jgi:PAS domain S-box-containing protein